MASKDLIELGIERQKFLLLPKVMNGGIGGVVAVSCIFPLDLVKTRLQNQQIGPNGEKMYKSILDCFRKTYRSEGYFGMYRGSAVNIMMVAPEKATKLASNDFFRHHLTTSDGQLSITRQTIAGGLAGLCQCTVSTPMDLMKIQMQDAGRSSKNGTNKTAKKLSARKIAVKLLRENGIFGLHRGIGAAAMRDVSFSIVYFPLFSHLNGFGPRKKDGTGDAVFFISFASGCVAGATAALSATPFDVIKTRLQLLKKAEGERQFNGIFDCIQKTFKHEGPRAFYKGGLCRIMVIAPVFGILQMVYFLRIAENILQI